MAMTMTTMIVVFACTIASPAAAAEPITLQQAVQLTLGHSSGIAIANDGATKAEKTYQEARNAFIPQLTVGSGLGYSYGFPLLNGAAPSVVNVSTQATFFNPAQRSFVQAAKLEWSASRYATQEQRDEAVQDAVLTYAEFDKWNRKLALLQQQESDSATAETKVAARIKEGLEPAIAAKKAQLTSARVRLLRVEAEGSADALRQHLAWLTGQPASEIATVTSSIPGMHALAAPEIGDGRQKAIASSSAVKSAEEHAEAEAMRARGEHRGLWPSLDLVGQYAVLSKTNNYSDYFNRFQRNNANFGIALRVPLFNASQKARAAGADADAMKARREADAARNRVAETTARLQQSVAQLAAVREVAELEFEIADADREAMDTRAESGTATFPEQQSARQQAALRQDALLDAEFDLTRARVQLLRATGDLEAWVAGK